MNLYDMGVRGGIGIACTKIFLHDFAIVLIKQV